jgi:hypothetical protein
MSKSESYYQQLAIEGASRRRAQRDEQEIADIANAMRHADERAEIHRRLCAEHGLNADATSPRMLADAEIAYVNGWKTFVSCRCAGGAQTSHILDPLNSGFDDRATIDEIEELRAMKSATAASIAARAAATAEKEKEDPDKIKELRILAAAEDAEEAKTLGERLVARFGGRLPKLKMIDELLAKRDRWRKQFEESWPPADLVTRLGSIDSAAQSSGHNTGARAA